MSRPWAQRGIGVYDDTPGSPSLTLQLTTAARLLGPAGWVVLFLQPCLPSAPDVAAFAAKLSLCYSMGYRVIVRLGWSGAMRDYADEHSNRTKFTGVAQKLAAVVAVLPLPPAHLGPLLVHAGNELNACNEWRCSEPAGAVIGLTTRIREVGGFMEDTMAALSALKAAQNGSLSLAHASIASWQFDGCICGSNSNVGTGRPGTRFLEKLVETHPRLYGRARWLSTHAYPYSNANYSRDPASKAFRGLTYYRLERAALNASAAALPAVLTETGWARNSPANPVTDVDQASWMRRAADEIWAPAAPRPALSARCSSRFRP